MLYLDQKVLKEWQQSAIKSAINASNKKVKLTFSSGIDNLEYEHFGERYIRVRYEPPAQLKQYIAPELCKCCLVKKLKPPKKCSDSFAINFISIYIANW